jgi:hypothetical protein
MTEQNSEATLEVVNDDQLIDNAMNGLDLDAAPKVPAEELKEAEKPADQGTGDEGEAVPSTDEQKDIEQPKVEKDKKLERIGRLTRQKYDLQAENERLRLALEKYQQKEGEKPIRGSFPDDATFDRATLKHELQQEMARETLEREHKELQRKQAESWESSVREQVADFDAFAKEYQANYTQLQREHELVEVATTSAIAPKVLEVFMNAVLKVPENKARWDAMSSTTKRMQLAQLETELLNGPKSEAQPAVAARSNAPQVVAPEKKSLKQQGQAPATDDELVLRAMREGRE